LVDEIKGKLAAFDEEEAAQSYARRLLVEAGYYRAEEQQ